MIARIPPVHRPKSITMRGQLFSVCGNLLVFAGGSGGPTELAALCWENGQRIADGAVDVRSTGGSFVARFVNPDGTDDFCGNALLAVCDYLGTRQARFRSRSYEIFAERRHAVVATIKGLRVTLRETGFREGEVTVVGVGTEHCVLRAESVTQYPLDTIGPLVTRELAASLTVYDFADGVAAARTFERGVEAETRSCGTGALAVQVVRGEGRGNVAFPGGTYTISIDRGASQLSLELPLDAIRFIRDV
jgi:diaminopimelate epimerase